MTDQSARDVHGASIVIDAHCDTIFVPLGSRRDLVTRSDQGDVDVPRLLQGGVTGQFMALLVNDEHRGAVKALSGVDSLLSACARCSELVLATSAADIRAAKASGRVAAVLTLESSDALEGDLSALRMFHRLGVRSMSLTHNFRNRAADGIFEARTGGGLSGFGREVVAEMGRLGMLLDVSHLSSAGVRDVLEITSKPFIASHSNAHAVWPHPRNLTDEQLTWVAERGGVVCISFVDKFLTDAVPALDHVLDHVDHVARVTGVDHVGIGSDFDGFVGPRPIGLEDVTRLPNLTAGMLNRGYSPEQVGKVLGGNLLRAFGAVCG